MIDTGLLKEDALNSLLGTIDSFQTSSKVLILDKTLATSVNVVSPFSVLKEHGVESIFWLQADNLQAAVSSALSLVSADVSASLTPRSLVFLTSTGLKEAYLVAQHTQQLIAQNSQLPVHSRPIAEVHIIVAPQSTLAFNLVLEESSVLGDVTIHSWPAHLLPVHPDLLSLNLDAAGFEETYIREIPSAVHLAADAIQDLQTRYGLIGRITGQGDNARLLADILLHKRQQRRTDLANDVASGPIGLLDSLPFAKALSQSTTASPAPSVANGSPAKDSATAQFNYKYSNVFVGTSIDELVIVDRKSDLVTPLLSQLTYEGLVDEFYSISDAGQVELPASVVNPPSQSSEGTSQAQAYRGETKRIVLGGETDALFEDIRDFNFSAVGQTLNRLAHQLKAEYESRHQAQTVSEIKKFVSKLGGLQSLHKNLQLHTNLADDLKRKVEGEEFNKWLEIQQNIVAESMDTSALLIMIEELINRSSSLVMVLRLISLECLCKGGIKEKLLQGLKHQIVQTYGYKHLVTLERLEKLGLIFARAPSVPNNFPSLRKALSLVMDQQQDDANPTDISFAYSGYAPLSVRLVQCVIDKTVIMKPRRLGSSAAQNSTLAGATGWRGAEDILRYLPGEVVEEQQHSESQVREAKLRKILTRNTPGHDKTTTLVFFLGGVTYAEVAALRFVAKQSSRTNVLIATTGLINGDKIIESTMRGL